MLCITPYTICTITLVRIIQRAHNTKYVKYAINTRQKVSLTRYIDVQHALKLVSRVIHRKKRVSKFFIPSWYGMQSLCTYVMWRMQKVKAQY